MGIDFQALINQYGPGFSFTVFVSLLIVLVREMTALNVDLKTLVIAQFADLKNQMTAQFSDARADMNNTSTTRARRLDELMSTMETEQARRQAEHEQLHDAMVQLIIALTLTSDNADLKKQVKPIVDTLSSGKAGK